jgi:hypothetical protein
VHNLDIVRSRRNFDIHRAAASNGPKYTSNLVAARSRAPPTEPSSSLRIAIAAKMKQRFSSLDVKARPSDPANPAAAGAR